MLVYFSTAYSQVQDKDVLMASVVNVIAKLTEQHRADKWHIVTPLFNHFILPYATSIGSDYAYWKDHSRELLAASDLLVVVRFPGMNIGASVGVQDEIESARILNKTILFRTATEILYA